MLKKESKRAVSGIIVNILLILIAIVAVILVATFLGSTIKEKIEQASFASSAMKIKFEIKNAWINYSDNKTMVVSVYRAAGKGEIDLLKFVLYDSSGKAYIFIENQTVKQQGELETINYLMNLSLITNLIDFSNIVYLEVYFGQESTSGKIMLSEIKDSYGYLPILNNGRIEETFNNYIAYTPITIPINTNNTNQTNQTVVNQSIIYDPILYLPFDGNLYDLSNSSLNGSWQQGIGSFVSGIFNQGIYYDGNNLSAYAQVANNIKLANMSKLTISVWAKKNQAFGGGQIFNKHVQYHLKISEVSIEGYLINKSGGRLDFKATTNLINDTAWHQYVLIYDGADIKLYLDNPETLLLNLPFSGAIEYFQYAPLLIGRAFTSPLNVFNGSIDELKIYNESSNPADIFICTSGLTRTCSLQIGVCSGSYQTCGSNKKWPGCTANTYFSFNSSYSAVEGSMGEPMCSDGKDNDCDGLIDALDIGCQNAFKINTRTGEETIFDAVQITNHFNLPRINWSWWFDWDFGDGIKNNPDNIYDSGGNIMSHYYTQPGIYEAYLTIQLPTLYVHDDNVFDINKSFPLSKIGTFLIKVNVTGNYSNAFEIWHADFNSRIAQKIYVRLDNDPLLSYDNKITLDVSSHPDYKLNCYIRGNKGYNEILFDKNSNLNMEEVFLLNNSKLVADNYTLTCNVLSGSNTLLHQINEYFEKKYEGLPIVGINEDNSLVVNGSLFFPVTSWMLNPSEVSNWAGKYVNTLYVVGYYTVNNVTTWNNYLTTANTNKVKVIGPAIWEGKGPQHWYRNSNVSFLKNYVASTKANSGLLGWMWSDEPNLGGQEQKLVAPTLKAWSALTNSLDGKHPSITQMIGYDYLKYYNYDDADNYNYLYNADIFGKKTAVADVTGFDIYPLEYRWSPNLNTSDGLFESFINGIEEINKRNYNLVPIFTFIEVQDIRAYRNTSGPTPEQIRSESWMAIVHGVKAINWFPYFEPRSAQNSLAMENFLNEITILGPIILSSPTNINVTDDADIRGKRVDTLVRKNATDTWLFSVRISEPDTEWVEVYENENISVTFNVSNIANGLASVFNESRSIPIVNHLFTDNFARDQVHIYKIN